MADRNRTMHPPISADVLCGRNWNAHRPRNRRIFRQAQAFDVHGWKLIVFTLVFLVCASQLAVALLNWLSTLLVKPCLLPRLDFTSGIPADLLHDGGRSHDAHEPGGCRPPHRNPRDPSSLES